MSGHSKKQLGGATGPMGTGTPRNDVGQCLHRLVNLFQRVIEVEAEPATRRWIQLVRAVCERRAVAARARLYARIIQGLCEMHRIMARDVERGQ